MLGQATLFATEATEPLRNRVELCRVEVRDIRQILERFHYLKRCRTGRQINYAVLIDGICDGVITFAYPMMSAPLKVPTGKKDEEGKPVMVSVPSDELLEFARLYLRQNIPHSASCAVGKSLKRIKADWNREYPNAKPVRLVVSWSDTEYHKGTIYKAANFYWLRRSLGASHGNAATSKRGAREKHADYSHDKDCWIYWLKDKQK